MRHRGFLTYFNSDDGVWLICDTADPDRLLNTADPCWQVNLGFSPTTEDAIIEWEDHRKTMHPDEVADQREQMQVERDAARAEVRALLHIRGLLESEVAALREEVSRPLRKDDPLIGHIRREVFTELRDRAAALPSAAFALTDHDPSPLVWKSDVLDLLEEPDRG